jgi:hypothetical protein
MDQLPSLMHALVAVGVLGAAAPSAARAQSTVPKPAAGEDHAVVYELGWAGEYSVAEGLHAKGATFAFEVTPVKDRLELECGITAIRAKGTTETSVDLLFKKPWSLSKRVEFMAGVGPELIHATGVEAGTFWGISTVADFMFWPSRNLGWYLEPGYDVVFRAGGTRQGFAVAAGLIIGR